MGANQQVTSAGEPLFREPPELLYVDAAAAMAPYLGVLREHYRVTTASTTTDACAALSVRMPALVVTELRLGDGPALEVCDRAKRLAIPASVLVTTTDVEQVPDALATGCDTVLLKPFAPNLLHARLARMMRLRTTALEVRTRSSLLRDRAREEQSKSAHLIERNALLDLGLVKVWPTGRCPYCDHDGPRMFDTASQRKAWYACLACRKVWLARRLG
jgi:DNA-binding response OmpR family regulator